MKKDSSSLSFSVPATNVLSNHLLEDLERLWQLRDIIPDPLNSEKTDTH